MRLIGISGKAGSGKDWATLVLHEACGFQKWSFAHPLKAAAMAQGFSKQEIAEKPPRVRKWMIDYGMDARARNINWWVDQVPYWLDQLQDMGIETVVIPDVRFANEAQFIRDQKGTLVRMWHRDRPYPLAGTEHAGSPSECELDAYQGFDLQFLNHLGTTPAQFLHECVKFGIIRHTDIERNLIAEVFSAPSVEEYQPQWQPSDSPIGL